MRDVQDKPERIVQCSGETQVLRHLADAVDALQAAASATGNGLVADYCINAQREINKALRCVIGED